MRCLILAFALFASACAQEEPPPPKAVTGLPPGIFAGRERDGLCISGNGAVQRAGFIVYGAGNSNCSASGKIEQAEGRWTLVPDGESACRIPLTPRGGTVTLGAAPAACAYYCAPGVSFDGKEFHPSRDDQHAAEGSCRRSALLTFTET